MAGPFAEDNIDDDTQIELGAESVKHHTTINARGGEGSLVDLEGVGALAASLLSRRRGKA